MIECLRWAVTVRTMSCIASMQTRARRYGRTPMKCALVAVQHEGGPGSTPTVAEGLVYTFSREGHAYCLRAEDGSEVWKAFIPDLTGIKKPIWGLTASPLVLNDKVIYEEGSLVALNKQDGSLIWKTQKRRPGYGSAIAFEFDGKTLVATLDNEGLLIVDPKDGSEVAFTEWKTFFDTNTTTPIYHDGMFFLSTGYKRGCGMFRFDGQTLSEVYTNKNLSNHINNSVIYDGHIYGIDGNAGQNCRLVCLDAASGEVKWSASGSGCGSLIVADGHLVVLSEKGRMVCGPALPDEFHPSGKFEAVDGKCWTVPVLANGHLYCRTAKGTLACWQLPPKQSSAGDEK